MLVYRPGVAIMVSKEQDRIAGPAAAFLGEPRTTETQSGSRGWCVGRGRADPCDVRCPGLVRPPQRVGERVFPCRVIARRLLDRSDPPSKLRAACAICWLTAAEYSAVWNIRIKWTDLLAEMLPAAATAGRESFRSNTRRCCTFL
jgi:hypothetical protein